MKILKILISILLGKILGNNDIAKGILRNIDIAKGILGNIDIAKKFENIDNAKGSKKNGLFTVRLTVRGDLIIKIVKEVKLFF